MSSLDNSWMMRNSRSKMVEQQLRRRQQSTKIHYKPLLIDFVKDTRENDQMSSERTIHARRNTNWDTVDPF